MKKYTTSERKTDLYDIGEGLTLMNILTKNGEGTLERIDTYIGVEGYEFSRVGYTEGLSEPGILFRYSDYMRMISANRDVYAQAFLQNTKR